ncbi:hypothetical protein M0804_011651 [Polistes exclamans]|nr:hypothetical protein M0804_011651 [Polistes exclamans]
MSSRKDLLIVEISNEISNVKEILKEKKSSILSSIFKPLSLLCRVCYNNFKRFNLKLRCAKGYNGYFINLVNKKFCPPDVEAHSIQPEESSQKEEVSHDS